jgi:hypothetical protein
MLLAYFFVVDKTNEDLAKEDEAFRQYLVANGWIGEIGDGSEGLRAAEDLKDDNRWSMSEAKRRMLRRNRDHVCAPPGGQSFTISSGDNM